MSQGYGSRTAIRTGEFIRDYLKINKEVYIQEIHRALKKAKGDRHTATLGSFRSYFQCLVSLELVEFVRTGEKPTIKGKTLDKLQPKRYYRITPGKDMDLAWRNPQKELDYQRQKRRQWEKEENTFNPRNYGK